MSRRERLTLLVITLLLSSGSQSARAEWVDWIAEAQADVQFTDNLNNSAFESDEEHDVFWSMHGRVGRVFQLTDRTRASLAALVTGQLYNDFEKLDSIEGGGELALFHKFGIGNAPWARIFFFGGYRHIRQDERSSRLLETGLTVGKRFSPRFDATLGYHFTNRDGGNGPKSWLARSNVWDQDFHTISLTGNYLLAEPLLLSVGYTFFVGEFDSACTSDNVGKVIDNGHVRAAALDPVFGGCVYRLHGTSHAPSVDLSYGITDHISVNLGYSYRRGKKSSLVYHRHGVQGGLIFSY
ncbi:MAG: hypothetical protein JRH16_05745 [Deltaproteobacteria bacterium]|nr:hypothetical protein [Deltaproteobacteria bacterium]MBW2361365.1 hypothetical protein [Deltaproteobacteria bacterium]